VREVAKLDHGRLGQHLGRGEFRDLAAAAGDQQRPGACVGSGTWFEATAEVKLRGFASTHASWLTIVSPKPLETCCVVQA